MSLAVNNDFLNQVGPEKKKRRTPQDIEKDSFPEYYALNISQRKSIDASNYWRIMNGQKFIEVPPSDEEYHKYFDKRCFDLAKTYQSTKK